MADSPPLKNASFTATFPLYDGSGCLIKGGGGLAACVSQDAGAFSAATCTVTELNTNAGVYYLKFTAAEMNADIVAFKAVSTSASARDAVGVMYTVTRQLKDLAFPATAGNGIVVSSASAVKVDAIVASTIVASTFAANAIHGAAVAASTIVASTLAANAIHAAAVAASTLTASKIGATALDNSHFAASILAASQFAANSIHAAAVAASTITASKFGANAIEDAVVATDMDTYQAKVWVFDDDTGAADRYTAIWFKNAQPVTSGITSPTIEVLKATDGTDLIASTSMTEIGSTGLYRYNETTAGNRMVSGSAYIAKAQATIDSAARTWYMPVGRDAG